MQSAKEIKKVAVLGSGVMGAAIAANVANSGVPVILMDIVPQGATDRNMLAKAAVDKMLAADPSAFTHPDNAKLVITANLEDGLNLLADVDWIIEAVIEKIEIKKDVYKKIDAVRKKGSVVSSNTSTIPLGKLTEGMSDAFKSEFVIAHFFNPPRYLRLLELVGGKDTAPESLEAVRQFCDYYLGKGIVDCKDTPGFIGNRIGCYWLQAALNEAIDIGISVEDADAIMGKPFGIPRTAVFGLYDLIGIDLMVLIGRSVTSLLPKADAYASAFTEHPLITKMIADGYTGRKGKGGFYRLVKVDGKKNFETLDLKSGEYKPQGAVTIASAKAKNLRDVFLSDDIGGKYAWQVMSKFISYTASLVPEIADDVSSIDEAMKTGYGFKYGPFEMLDLIGAKWFADKLKAEGREVPAIIAKVGDGTFYKTEATGKQYFATSGAYTKIPVPAGIISIAEMKLSKKPILKNESAQLWDTGDGIACLEYTTKMNAADNGVLEMIEKAVDEVKRNFKGMIIATDADNFSVGANLNFFLDNAKSGNFKAIEDIIARGQQAFFALKTAPFPVISALNGLALGGGCEVVLHSSAVNAHIESYAGLVEIGVGVIPGWGGCKEMLIRYYEATGDIAKAAELAFEAICSARVSKSAQDARDMRILNKESHISMNRLRVMADAKAMARTMAANYKQKQATEIPSGGAAVKAALEAKADAIIATGKGAPHDMVIMKQLAYVLSGGGVDGKTSEQKLYDLEREAFVELVKTKGTQDRIEYMLQNGKPLKN